MPKLLPGIQTQLFEKPKQKTQNNNSNNNNNNNNKTKQNKTKQNRTKQNKTTPPQKKKKHPYSLRMRVK